MQPQIRPLVAAHPPTLILTAEYPRYPKCIRVLCTAYPRDAIFTSLQNNAKQTSGQPYKRWKLFPLQSSHLLDISDLGGKYVFRVGLNGSAWLDLCSELGCGMGPTLLCFGKKGFLWWWFLGHTWIYIYIYVCMYIYIYVCIYICMYIYIHMRIYVYILGLSID